MTGSRGDPSFVRIEPGLQHPVVDTDALAREFGRLDLPPRDMVMGPVDYAMLERARSEHAILTPAAVPTDVFLLGTGEPENRATTKLGGLPYLPASRPWPERRGTTADFYGQLNFLDSREIVPETPGDVLLVFRFHDLDHSSWDEQLYEFIWVDVEEQELIPAERVRHSVNGATDPWPAVQTYRVRSFDDDQELERVRGNESIPGHVLSACATKIGGVPTDRQSIWRPEVPDDWRFLGQFAAHFPRMDVPYPAVNHPAPIRTLSPEYRALTGGPGDGVTCLYLAADEGVRIRFSCA